MMSPMNPIHCIVIILMARLSCARNHVGQEAGAIQGVVPKNWFQDGICLIQDGLDEIAGLCIWGQNCGGGCAQYSEYGIVAWNDELDKACLEHDICLCNALSISERRTCDKKLEMEAKSIAEENDQCTGLNNLNPFCINDEIVCAAYNIENAMRVVGSGDTINNDCFVNNQDESARDEQYEYDYNKDYAHAPKPKSEPEPEPNEAPEKLEKFNFEMEWNPTACFRNSSCDESKHVNAFTISEMTAKLEDRQANNTRCIGKNSNEAKELNVTENVSNGTLQALQCIYANAAGDNEEMWHSLYVKVGSCTGLSVSDYFDTMVQLYKKVNLNNIINNMGIVDGKSVLKEEIDRDTLLDTVSAAVGKKAWVECDPDLRILRNVLVCVSPDPPYEIIDCTMDRNDPTSTNGIPCDGMLKLPSVASGNISDTCQPYIPFSTPMPTLPPLSSSPSPVPVSISNLVETGSTSNAHYLMSSSVIVVVFSMFTSLHSIVG